MEHSPLVQAEIVAPNQGKIWSPEDREQLKVLFLHGFDLKALCERMGRTPHGILSQLASLKLLYCDQQTGHYFPFPTEPWCMWQEVKELNNYYKGRRATDGS